MDHVLGPLEIMDQRQRRAEGKVPEAPRQLNKGSHVAARCQAHQTFVIYGRFHALKCQERVSAFRGKSIFFKAP